MAGLPDTLSKAFTAPVSIREPRSLWTGLAWAAAVAWPPVILTLFIFPPTAEAGGILNDWRLKALIAGGVAVGAIIWIIAGERERDGSPSTRLGILSRFLLFGFIFTLAALILLVLIFSFMTLFGSEGFLSTLGEIESTLFLFGVAGLPPALMVGVSYAIWAGLMVALIGYMPKPPKPSYMRSPLFGEEAVPPPAPQAPPPPRAPEPPTEVERGLMPGVDDDDRR